jgi:protein involved in polysaccharide export with SLBB domain
MRFSLLALLLVAMCAMPVVAQTPTADQLSVLKNLPADQQQQLLQGVMGGKGDGSGKKIDPMLQTPDTVRQKDERLDQYDRYIKDKTVDGRPLRLQDEDPEIRADDTVLIDLVPIERRSRPIVQNSTTTASGAGTGALNGLTSMPNSEAGANHANGNQKNEYDQVDKSNNDDPLRAYGRSPYDDKPLTDLDKQKIEDFRQRILKNNPYRVNRFGVLELPGLPSIPIAGLTATEASNRLSADPDLRDFLVKVTLLRLRAMGEEALKPFGYDLFEGVPSTFAPVSDIQVPMDYVVGPGDTLQVQLYGNEPASYSLTVGRDGRINFPKLGPINVSGMSFQNALSAIEQRVSQQLIGSRVSVTMGDLRSIRVFVLGEAAKPGSYTVSGLSTMTNALFVSGGVKKIGSLRNIQLKRNGKLITVLDLYDLLLRGDTSGDRQLLPGDVIFIPPIGHIVSVDGAVQRPAIYEIKGEKTVEDAVQIAGGLLPDADAKIAQMERILPSSVHEMQNIDLTSPVSRNLPLANGDKLLIPLIRPTLENSVSLTGFVFRPGNFEYKPGLHLSDILGSFDELRPSADRHYIMIRREVPPEEKVEVVSADLERVLADRHGSGDPELRPRDKIFVFDLSASRERIIAPVVRDLELQATPEQPAQLVTIDGKVKAPGKYPLQPGMHVTDLIRAGGSMDDSAFVGQAELTRYAVDAGDTRQTALISIDLAAIRRGDANANIELRPYDVLVIKPIPLWEQPGTIVLSGEVRFPGKYPIHRGETLKSVLERAGGFTDLAFPEGAIFIREELKQRERDLLDLLVNRMQSDLAALTLESVSSSVATSSANAGNSAAASIAIGQQLISQLREAKPVGRLVIDINKVSRKPVGSSDDVELRDGDKLLIPKRVQEITILGEVQSPTSHVYEPGLTRDDYIAKSGGVTQKADPKRIYVVRANGDVISGERHGWFRRSQSIEMHAGDTIVVPLDTERIRALPLWQAVTTILYNLAVALLAVRSV